MKISDAILAISPTAQFVIYGDDYSTIRWDSQDVPQPTIDEINTVMAQDVPEPLPPIQDQINAILEGGDALDSLIKKVRAIQTKGGALASGRPT